jgi:glycosyltransferase involved in cell wall biosynthesis
MPKVSVIVPVYGVERYIERCARSLFEQTLNDVEYIFIDDCSPDKSVDILNKLIGKYVDKLASEKKTVRVLTQPTNGGLAAVRRLGLEMFSGDYVIHCDSDDWVEPNWLELLYNKALSLNLDVVFCDYYRASGVKTVIKNRCVDGRDKEYYMHKLLTRCIISSVWNKLVKGDIYRKNEFVYPKHNMWEDYVLSVQTFFYAERIGYVDAPLYNYFLNAQSICFQNIDVKQKQILENSRIIIDFIKSHSSYDSCKNDLVVLKNTAREELLAVLHKREYYRMWYNTYREINVRYLLIPGISVKDRLRFLIILLGLYPLVRRKS